MEEPVCIGDWNYIGDLGAGAFGKVTLWKSKITNESYAVKMCKIQMKANITARQRERWKKEVDIMKIINHENIVSYKRLPDILLNELNRYNPTELPILSMEYCTKGNLRNHLRTPKNIKGLQETEVRSILSDISNAIAYLHDMGITHRDLKPENIVLQECNDRPNNVIYKVIDLGYAKELSSLGLSFVGTLPYLAPEIFRAEKYDRTVDYWSFGISAYEVITGELPFLPYLSPVERFEFIKQKSEDDICIWLTSISKPLYSKDILASNFISTTLKKHLESWLRLVLQYDPQKRGTYRGERKDVLQELRTILAKKIIKVFSIYNFSIHSFEISTSTTIGEVKALLEACTSVPKNKQVLIFENKELLCKDEEIVVECLPDCQTEFYMFRKKEFVDRNKRVSIPKQLDVLFTGPPIRTREQLRSLCLCSMHYVMKQNEVAELLKKSVKTVLENCRKQFNNQWVVYYGLRQNMLRLCYKVECYEELNDALLGNDRDDNLTYLSEYRKLLRQIKELTENFNGMTERFLKTVPLDEHLLKLYEIVKKTFDEVDINVFCDNLITLVQKITPQNIATPSADLKKILSNVLKIFSGKFLNNNDLGNFLKYLSHAYNQLEKLEKWCNALDKEIVRISNELLHTQSHRLKVLSTSANSVSSSAICVSLPPNIHDSLTETENLLQENMDLRYMIQDKVNENFARLGLMQKEMFSEFNGISFSKNMNR